MKGSEVRIAAGEFRGRKLDYPPGRHLRPTMQKTREAVFSAIAHELRGSVFIDLFAGGGAMGIEALSRGAAFAHFVENDRRAIACLERNLADCRLDTSRAKVHATAVDTFLSRLTSETGTPAGIVYADPPYDGAGAEAVLAHFDQNAYDGLRLLLVEHRSTLPPPAARMRLFKEKRYGEARVSFFTPSEKGDS